MLSFILVFACIYQIFLLTLQCKLNPKTRKGTTIMSTLKLYLIIQYEAQMACECGINVVKNMPKDTRYYKAEILQEADVQLPVGYTIVDLGDNRSEIFCGKESAEIVTEQREAGVYVTSLVSSEGIVDIKTWNL